MHQPQVIRIKPCFEAKGCLPQQPRAPCRRVITYLPMARPSARGAGSVAMPGFGLLLATTAVAVLAFGAVLNRARAAYAWFDALVAPEDDQSISVDDALRTVWLVLTVLLVPVSDINWRLLKWLALIGRLILHELLQNIWFAMWLVSLPLRWVSEFMVALQQIFWSTPRSDASKRLRADQLAAREKRAANLLGQGGTWPVAAAAGSVKGGASRPSRRLERANSALRALLERRARCAEEAQRAVDNEEARARKRRKARAAAVQGWQSMPTGRKLFWICLAVLIAAPRTTTPIAGPTSWLGLQVANEKLQQVMSVNHAMDLLLEYGPEGFVALLIWHCILQPVNVQPRCTTGRSPWCAIQRDPLHYGVLGRLPARCSRSADQSSQLNCFPDQPHQNAILTCNQQHGGTTHWAA